jgi:hypothetical protein
MIDDLVYWRHMSTSHPDNLLILWTPTPSTVLTTDASDSVGFGSILEVTRDTHRKHPPNAPWEHPSHVSRVETWDGLGVTKAPSLVRWTITINSDMMSNVLDQRIKTFEDIVLSGRGDPGGTVKRSCFVPMSDTERHTVNMVASGCHGNANKSSLSKS